MTNDDALFCAARDGLALARARLRGFATTGIVRPPVPSAASEKGPGDFHTDLDLAVENDVAHLLLDRFPTHGVISEEAVHVPGDGGHVWYLDPLDGTHNLVAGRPEIAVSLALYRHGAPVIAVIDLPLRGIEVAAVSGRPDVLVNGKPFQPPAPAAVKVITLPGDLRSHAEREAFHHAVSVVSTKGAALRITGAVAYDVATMLLGETAARVSFNVKPVDIAAAPLLLSRIGGVATSVEGDPFELDMGTLLAATSTDLHADLLAALRSKGSADA